MCITIKPEQLDQYQKLYNASLRDMAKWIGVSTQTMYNLRNGKPIKTATRHRIETWIHLENKHSERVFLEKLFSSFDASFHAYHQEIIETWRRKMDTLSPDSNRELIDLLEELSNIKQDIQNYHDIVKRIFE